MRMEPESCSYNLNLIRSGSDPSPFHRSMDSPSKHPLNHPKHSVPDAEAKRQHDSWPAKRRLFKFPGEDSNCQDAEYCTYDFGEHNLLILYNILYRLTWIFGPNLTLTPFAASTQSTPDHDRTRHPSDIFACGSWPL
jgi:hypothetical protein